MHRLPFLRCLLATPMARAAPAPRPGTITGALRCGRAWTPAPCASPSARPRSRPRPTCPPPPAPPPHPSRPPCPHCPWPPSPPCLRPRPQRLEWLGQDAALQLRPCSAAARSPPPPLMTWRTKRGSGTGERAMQSNCAVAPAQAEVAYFTRCELERIERLAQQAFRTCLA